MDLTKFKSTSIWPVVLSYGLGYFWVIIFLNPGHVKFSWFPLFFVSLFFGWAEWTMRDIPRPHKEANFWMASVLLIAVAQGIGGCFAGDVWGVLAMHVLAIYWVLVRSGRLTEGRTGACLLLDAWSAFCYMFSSVFWRIRRVLYAVAMSRTNWRSLIVSVIVIALAIPVFLWTASLLGSADALFASVWGTITNVFSFEAGLPEWLSEFLIDFCFGLPVGACIYGLVTRCVIAPSNKFSAENVHKKSESFHWVPQNGIVIICSSFITLYLLFFGIQATHLFGAFVGDVPGSLTASEYAREGFFQLCKVMLINFGLFVMTVKGASVSIYDSKLLKRLNMGLLGESAFLAVTAASKLGLYIERFGWTELRLLSFWLVLVLFAGCVLAIAHLATRCRVIDKWIWFAVTTFVLLSFVDVP